MFHKDVRPYQTLESTARGFFSPDPKMQKTAKAQMGGRPAMWVSNYYPPGPRQSGYTAHVYLIVDTGDRMILFNSFSKSRAAESVKACGASYGEEFQRVAGTLRPVGKEPEPKSGPVRLLR